MILYEFITNMNKHALSRYLSKSIFFIENPEFIDWNGLSTNTSEDIFNWLISYYPDKITKSISSNKSIIALNYLRKHPELIDFFLLSSNDADDAILLLSNYPKQICLTNLKGNINPLAKELFDKVIELPLDDLQDLMIYDENDIPHSLNKCIINNINIPNSKNSVEYTLNVSPDILPIYSTNDEDIEKLLLNDEQNINWNSFSENPSNTAITYLINNPEKIIWYYFCHNIGLKNF